MTALIQLRKRREALMRWLWLMLVITSIVRRAFGVVRLLWHNPIRGFKPWKLGDHMLSGTWLWKVSASQSRRRNRVCRSRVLLEDVRPPLGDILNPRLYNRVLHLHMRRGVDSKALRVEMGWHDMVLTILKAIRNCGNLMCIRCPSEELEQIHLSLFRLIIWSWTKASFARY